MKRITENDVQVLRLLKKGADNKITKHQLMKATGLNARNLFETIEVLRSLGIPIMASRKVTDAGYYIAQNQTEKTAGIAQYKKQIATEKHNLELLENTSIDNYLHQASKNPDFWRLYGSELLKVTTTSNSAIISIKNTL